MNKRYKHIFTLQAYKEWKKDIGNKVPHIALMKIDTQANSCFIYVSYKHE